MLSAGALPRSVDQSADTEESAAEGHNAPEKTIDYFSWVKLAGPRGFEPRTSAPASQIGCAGFYSFVRCPLGGSANPPFAGSAALSNLSYGPTSNSTCRSKSVEASTTQSCKTASKNLKDRAWVLWFRAGIPESGQRGRP